VQSRTNHSNTNTGRCLVFSAYLLGWIKRHEPSMLLPPSKDSKKYPERAIIDKRRAATQTHGLSPSYKNTIAVYELADVDPDQPAYLRRSHSKMEIDMVDKITAGLALALMLFSAGAASAQPRAEEARSYYDQARSQAEQFCYLPSEPCDNQHSVTN
jgi:hypothetical protein